MEQKPHKKEELMVANSVLKLAEDLLKVTINYTDSHLNSFVQHQIIVQSRFPVDEWHLGALLHCQCWKLRTKSLHWSK